MEISIFQDKAYQPGSEDLRNALGATIDYWNFIRNYVFEKYPAAVEEWNFPGKKYGWSFRIKDKKRAIVYFLPREKYFEVAFVFGLKVMEKVLASDVSAKIKTDLENAVVYAEGRGVRIDVLDENVIGDIKKIG